MKISSIKHSWDKMILIKQTNNLLIETDSQAILSRVFLTKD